MYELHDKKFLKYLLQKFSKLNRTEEMGLQEMLTRTRKKTYTYLYASKIEYR